GKVFRDDLGRRGEEPAGFAEGGGRVTRRLDIWRNFARHLPCPMHSKLMRYSRVAPVLLLVIACGTIPASGLRGAEAEPIDPASGRALMQKASAGETLTPEEQAYLERVKQAIRERTKNKQGGAAPAAKAKAASPAVAANPADWSALVAITDMTAP